MVFQIGQLRGNGLCVCWQVLVHSIVEKRIALVPMRLSNREMALMELFEEGHLNFRFKTKIGALFSDFE